MYVPLAMKEFNPPRRRGACWGIPACQHLDIEELCRGGLNVLYVEELVGDPWVSDIFTGRWGRVTPHLWIEGVVACSNGCREI